MKNIMTVGRRQLAFASAVLLVALGAGFGARQLASSNAATAAANIPQSSGPNADFDHPFADGTAVSDLSTAASRLSFKPVLPTSVGSPLRIEIHADATPAQQAVGLSFNSKLGHFIVTENPSTMSQTELEALATSCDPAAGCEGTWKVISLDDGTHALAIDSSKSVGVMWLRNGVQYDVYGDPSTFTPSVAQTIANAFAAIN
jgi:hypothetical protein